jgi:hypothetical protein
MSKSKDVIRFLYKKGYRVSDNGVLTNPKGKIITIKIKSNHKYPQTQAIMDGEKVNYHLHRLAAYCFYGEEMFKEGICVRHLSGDVLDISKRNIAIGTYSENEKDKDPRIRSINASNSVKQRKDTRRLTMRRFSDDEVIEIRERLSNGEKGAHIAKEYGVVKDVIYQIKRGETYKEIK